MNDPDPNTQQWIDRLARLPPAVVKAIDGGVPGVPGLAAAQRHRKADRKQQVELPVEMWLPLEKTATAATDLFLSPEVIQSILDRT